MKAKLFYELGSGITVIEDKQGNCELSINGTTVNVRKTVLQQIIQNYFDEVENATIRETVTALHRRFGYNKKAAKEFSIEAVEQIIGRGWSD